MFTAASRKNLVIAMALAGAALLAFNRWVLPALFDLRPIRDGVGAYARDDQRLRVAVWESPRDLEGALDTEGRESHARLSPDGRWIAYCAGEVGQGTELFLAEVVGGIAQAPRALAELNSGADDSAPAWGADALYFASDRAGGAGGFDLYRATWDGRSFGPVEPASEANGPSNECEPAPADDGLYFASDRGGAGFDLFFCASAGASAALTRVELLSSASHERDPFVTPDGRALYFASNRSGGGDDFDLHRSFRDRGAWLPPERIAGLHSRVAERAPATSPDGLTLHFVREGDPAAELLVSRSIELFRGAEPARGWADLWLMAALLLLALVAALSKRWEELDLLYKCALASVIAHFLILALLRFLYPSSEAWEKQPEREPRIRVRLEAPRERLRGLVERGGQLEAQRSSRVEDAAPQPIESRQFERVVDAAPDAQALERTEVELAQAPAPREAELERVEDLGASVTPSLGAPSESRERRSAVGDEPRAATPSSSSVARSERESSAPVAVRVPTVDESDAAPNAASLTRLNDDGASAPAVGAFTPVEVERSSASAAERGGPSLALPAEARARLDSGERSAPAAPARSFAAERRDAAGDAAGAGPEHVQIARGVDAPTADAPAGPRELTRSASPNSEPATASEFTPAAGERATNSEALELGPAVALPSEERLRSALPSEEAPSAPAPTAIAPLRRTSPDADAGPSERVAAAPASDAPIESAAPAQRPLAAAPRSAAVDAPPAPRKLDDTPYRSRFGAEKEIALREHGGTEETERAVANGLRYLASRQRRDGAWGSRNDHHPKYRDVRIGKSGLALLAFLGAGHTPGAATEYANVADLAVKWLLSTQDPATGHFGDCEAYGHGIATYALAECYALTRDERLGDAVTRAVQRIVEQQITHGDPRSVGGWSYFYPDGALFDRWPRASITAWQVMALESARLGGIAVPDAAFERAREFLRGSWDAELGRFRYSHDPERLNSGYATLPGSTPAALFALSLLGEDLATNEWGDAIGFVQQCAPNGYRWEGEDAFVQRAGGNLYFWYYGSLALLRRGGAPWERWNVALKESLPPAQERDGSWAPLDVYSEYAGDDDRDRIYSTAMCVLSLEVYYRYFTPLLKVR